MALAALIAVLLMLLYLNAWMLRSFLNHHSSRAWWAAAIVCWWGGMGLGFWSSTSFEYGVSPTLRVAGAPMPLAFFVLEGRPGEQAWIDYIVHYQLLSVGFNMLFMGLLLGVLLGAVYLIRGSRA